MSGRPLPMVVPSLIDGGTPTPTCHGGRGKAVLMPPAVTPLSFHVISLKPEPETSPIVVPPTAVTHGSQAGKQTWARPSGSSALPIDPLSPDAANTVTPLPPASWKKELIVASCDALQSSSSQAQLMVITAGDGWPAPGTMAVVIAEIHPVSVLLPMK